MSDTEKEQRIRERAYQLWKAEGEQHGQSDEYWARAVAMEAEPPKADTAAPAKSPAKASAPKAKSPAASPAAKPATETATLAAAGPKAPKRAKASPTPKK